MKKSEIVNSISCNTGISKVEVQKVVEAFIVEVIKALKERGDYVEIRAFGRFYVKKRKAKVGRNISKNTSMYIPETHVPSFRPAKYFLETIKKSMSGFTNVDQ